MDFVEYYTGQHDLEIKDGIIALPNDIIDTYLARNASFARHETKFYSSGRRYMGGVVTIPLFDEEKEGMKLLESEEYGYLLIPEEFKDILGLKKEVALVGMLDHFELWNPLILRVEESKFSGRVRENSFSRN